MKEYCTQNNGDCLTCSLVNYARDCRNMPLIFAHCKRCEHEWMPRTNHPKFCPHCNSPYWDKPKRRK